MTEGSRTLHAKKAEMSRKGDKPDGEGRQQFQGVEEVYGWMPASS